MNSYHIIAPLVCQLVLIFPLCAQQMDPSFGINGQAIVNGPSGFYGPIDLAEGDDGSLLVGGGEFSATSSHWFAYRCDQNGYPLTSFSDDGLAFMNPCISNDDIVAVAIDPQGRSVLAGYENWMTTFKDPDQVVIGRFLPNGQADISFGDTLGMKYYRRPISGGTMPVAMSIKPNSHINIGCHLYSETLGGSSFQLDEAGNFADGQLPQDHPEPEGWFSSFSGVGCALNDGGIALCGNSWLASNWQPPSKIMVLKLDSTLSPDPTFSENGWYSEFSSTHLVRAVSVNEDGFGRLVVMATRHPGNEKYLFRILLDGTKDLSFGTNGEVLLSEPFSTNFDVASDGRIILLGGSEGQVRITMLDASGELSTDFGLNGVYVPPITIYSGLKRAKFASNDQALFLITGGSYGGQRFGVFKILADQATPVDDLTSRIRVYPNPTEGLITIESTHVDYIDYNLINIVGQVVIRGTFVSGEPLTADLSVLAPGRYVLSLNGRNGEISRVNVHKE